MEIWAKFSFPKAQAEVLHHHGSSEHVWTWPPLAEYEKPAVIPQEKILRLNCSDCCRMYLGETSYIRIYMHMYMHMHITHIHTHIFIIIYKHMHILLLLRNNARISTVTTMVTEKKILEKNMTFSSPPPPPRRLAIPQDPQQRLRVRLGRLEFDPDPAGPRGCVASRDPKEDMAR